MEHVFPTVLAALMLVPVLFLFRTGLSSIGIAVVSALSFVLVQLFVWSQWIFPMWQSLLLTLLLLVCSVYLLQAKLYSFLMRDKQAREIHDEEDDVWEEDIHVDREQLFFTQFMDEYRENDGNARDIETTEGGVR